MASCVRGGRQVSDKADGKGERSALLSNILAGEGADVEKSITFVIRKTI